MFGCVGWFVSANRHGDKEIEVDLPESRYRHASVIYSAPKRRRGYASVDESRLGSFDERESSIVRVRNVALSRSLLPSTLHTLADKCRAHTHAHTRGTRKITVRRIEAAVTGLRSRGASSRPPTTDATRTRQLLAAAALKFRCENFHHVRIVPA